MDRSTGDEVDGSWALERGEVIRKKTKVRSKKLDVESRSQKSGAGLLAPLLFFWLLTPGFLLLASQFKSNTACSTGVLFPAPSMARISSSYCPG
jgi:hypothetical protein